MKNNKKIRIKDEMKHPLRVMQERYSTELACLDAIFLSRAKKETGGCLGCGGDIIELYRPKAGRRAYQCSKCFFQVSPLVGTILERTHVLLVVWFEIILNKLINHSGFSANKIAYLYSLGDGTAWKLLMRIRHWMYKASEGITLSGKVEIDETAIPTGTKGLGRHRKKRRGFGSDSQSACLTMVERNGNVKSVMILDRDEDTILPIILNNVDANATIYTDEFRSYSKLKSLGYDHKKVNHSKYEFKNEDACTNSAEGYFGLVKPNIRGTYRSITEPYAQYYLSEHDFRYNNRNNSLETRFQKLLDCLPPLFEHIRNPKKLKQSN